MIVASASIAAQQNYQFTIESQRTARLQYWTGARPQARTEAVSTAALPEGTASITPNVQSDSSLELDQDANLEPRLRLLKCLAEFLSGHRLHLLTGKDAENMAENAAANASKAGGGSGASRQSNIGLEYDASITTREVEQSTFSAQGVIHTRDGRTVSFSLDLQMRREQVTEQSVQVRLGNAVQDPLVINFDGRAAELSETQSAFDLNADGQAEMIATLKPHSGYLALDQDGDGKITSGRELFGPATGDGWQELAAYDSDSNGWIDEADPVFRQLLVWGRDEQGREQLTAASDKGVGAICLQVLATPFEIQAGDQSTLGEVRSTGVWLNENGEAGTMQQLDLAATPAEAPRAEGTAPISGAA